MKSKQIVIVLLLLLPFLVFLIRYYRSPERLEVEDVHQADEFVVLHRDRVTKLVKILKQENFQQSFSGLVEEPQYLYPGYLPPNTSPLDMESLLSARRFLKVRQTYQSLSERDAKKELISANQECRDLLKRAISNLRVSRSDPTAPTNTISFLSLRRMFLTTMLMAVHLGDKQVVFDLRDFWEQTTNDQIDYMTAHPEGYPDKVVIVDAIFHFDDSAYLTVLLHLAKKLNIHSEQITKIQNECEKDKDTSPVPKAKDIPLGKWDGMDSHYDVHVKLRYVDIDKNVVEKFPVYYLPTEFMYRKDEAQKIIQTIRQPLQAENQ